MNNKVDVYKEENIFEKIPSVPIIKEYNGKSINISKGILYKDEKNPYNVYQYDLTKEKIINKWNIEGVHIFDICNQNKNWQITDYPIIYGLNQKIIFKMDSRINNRNNMEIQ